MQISQYHKKVRIVILSLALIFGCNSPTKSPERIPQKSKYGIVIHGGAGTIKREMMDSITEKAYRQKLEEALQAGYAIIESGGTSCDAVQAAILVMEDSPLFNAGVGAVLTATGENELDASIMDGKTLYAGAIAGAKTIKNPILAARKVMTSSPHVMLSGDGASDFAESEGLEIVDPSYFKTERRIKQLDKIIKKLEKEFGTVGAVALDKEGNLCAGTSTGGMTNKKWGRIGDAPIIGAGTYANNNTCGFSGTGHGEYYIRSVAGHDISALMEYKGMSVEEAANEVMNKIETLGGNGGMIAMDRFGNIALPFNTSGMYRGYLREGESPQVMIFQNN